MRRFLMPGLITLAAVALLAVLASGVADQGTSSSIDAQVARGHYPVAPGLHQQLPLLGVRGKESLAALRGKVVLLNVFASWCPPCAAEAPLLERAQHLLQRHDGTVLGVTYLDAASDSEAFMRQHHLTYPVVRDVNGNFVRSYGVDGVPETFVINRTGHVEALDRLQLSAQWLNQTLPKIVGQSS
jgi:cytochrome c biogenesis protein CcmG/thiol:disulfide interchange protein DsbE